jgi:predicted AAA+ superfamily ATPase
MDVSTINRLLATGTLDAPGLFPHLEALTDAAFVFRPDFGLDRLPDQPGLLVVRGARQYGKSTWLEGQLRDTIARYGPGSAYYLNGDEIGTAEALVARVRELVPLFSPKAAVRRLFVDEVTAVAGWADALKRLVDAGELRRVLVVTTGSKATDLRRGSERLPGRRGTLDRTTWIFTPVSYAEFSRVCGDRLGADLLPAYLLTGGCPLACGEMAARGHLPEYVVTLARDWILGEVAGGGRSRASLLAVMGALHRWGGTPVGQAKLARETGLANNTVAAGYLELLADLLSVGISHPLDASRGVRLVRRPAKFPFTNLLVAAAWAPDRPRSVADVRALEPSRAGTWLEWLVAEELWRRAALRGDEAPELLDYWEGGGHELDFAPAPEGFVEVKHGRTSPIEYAWFPRVFPKGRLTVIGRDRWEAEGMRGVTIEDFLLGEPPP